MEQTLEELEQEQAQQEEQQQVTQQPHVVSRQQYSTQQIISSALNAAASPAPASGPLQQQIQYQPQQQVQHAQIQGQQVQVVQPTPFAGGEIARRLLSLQPQMQTPNPLLGHHQQYQQHQLQQHQQNQNQQQVPQQQQQQVIPNPLLHPVMVYQQVPQVQQQQGQQQQPQQTLPVVGLAAAPNLITPSSSLSSSMSLSRTKSLSSSMSSSSHNHINNSNNHNAAFQLNPSASVPVALLSCNNYNNTSNNNGTHNGNNNHNAVFTNVLEQQRETIARNQQIIDAQNNKLGQVAAKYSTIQKAAVAIIKYKKTIDTVTVKKEEESNSYLKWKGTTAGASKLTALEDISDDTLITSSVKSMSTIISNKKKLKKKGNVVISSKGRQQQPQQQLPVHPSQQQSLLFGINNGMGSNSLTIHNHGRHIRKPELLEARRERNRKHAKKNRQRKKSLTTDLEQSLEGPQGRKSKITEMY